MDLAGRQIIMLDPLTELASVQPLLKTPATRRSTFPVRCEDARKGQSMLLVDPVGALTLVRFEGLDGESGLLHRAGHEPAHSVLLPSIFNLWRRLVLPSMIANWSLTSLQQRPRCQRSCTCSRIKTEGTRTPF